MTPEQQPEPFMDDLARLRAVLDSAVEGIITIDDRGMMEAVNAAAERLFGYTAAEMCGRNVSMLMPSPERENHDSHLAQFQRTGIRKIIGIGREVTGQRKDGSTFPMYIAVSEVSFGHRRAFTGFLHDLTELRRAEQSLLERDAQLEFMVEHLPAAAAYIDVETQAVRFNPMVAQVTGYTVQEMATLDDCFRRLFGKRADAVRQRYDAHHGHRLEQPVCWPIQHKSGDRRVIEFRGYRYDDHEVWLLNDVTERDRHETELRIRNQAIQASNEGMLIADARTANHPIVFVNRAFETLTGYAADEAIGHGCELLCGPEADSEAMSQLQSSIARHQEFRTTVQCVRKDGTVFWNEISVAPVHSAAGVVTHVVAVMEDVSEHRRAQQQLLQSERLAAIGQMVTGLAHESRNALQRAQACVDMLTLDVEDQPEQLELTNKIRRALDDLHRHYEEVRNYAAPISLERRSTDVALLWRDTWRNLESTRQGRDFQLLEVTGDTDTTCDVDEHRLRQVFRNIMENALAACGDPGRLTVSSQATTDDGRPALCISFRDNGPGFDSVTAEKVFQPFFSTKQKGTGLGMAIAKRIVDAHDGQIRIANVLNPNHQAQTNSTSVVHQGAEIVITLPRTATTPHKARLFARNEPNRANTHTRGQV